MNDVNVQRNYKDTVFRMLFDEKENLLSLYNAVNGTAYTDGDKLEVTTLENAVYMDYKNDLSFVFDFRLMVYEHQSTVNPNMPLRDLFYVAKVLQARVRNENLYSAALVKIPAPNFIVFYNGAGPQPEQKTLLLSDAYEKRPGQPELELAVSVYNINLGHNAALLGACSLLKEYAQYVDRVRVLAKAMSFPDAVESAVDYCIKNGILADFLSKNRAEAIAVSIFEYDEEKHMKSEREEWRNIGRQEGIEQGRSLGREEGIRQGRSIGREEGIRQGRSIGREEGIKQGRSIGQEEGQDKLARLLQKLINDGKGEELERVLSDHEYREKLYQENSINN